jgi:hypothetical protein
MPIRVTDLKPGDRVVLNCPKARRNSKREAQFEGIFESMDDAMNHGGKAPDVLLMEHATEAFLAQKVWARFLLQTVSESGQVLRYPGGDAMNLPKFAGITELSAAFLVEPDGSLREEEGRRVFIERRVFVGQG